MTAELSRGAMSLDIRWPDGTVGTFPYIWLRDTDPTGFHPQTGERTFDLTQVSLDIAPDRAAIEDDTLMIRWPDAETDSRFDLNWIKTHRPGQKRTDPADIAPKLWGSELGADGVPRHDATAILNDYQALLAWLCDTKLYGLSIVDGLADDIDAGVEVARRVGHLRETNFGLTFEVVSKPDPNNLAYTSDALPLHTDLTNQELPPGFQFLHCLANEAEGGGSTFCDGFAVAKALREVDPEAFEVLSRIHVPFRFQDKVTDIRSRKAVITLNERNEVDEICFNAHIADVLDLDADEMIAFYRAYKRYMELSRDDSLGIALKLKGGEMVVFDNRRVLHGREAFDPSTGYRHLHGCYVDRGEWDSRLRVVAGA